jgi:hypothetical protein
MKKESNSPISDKVGLVIDEAYFQLRMLSVPLGDRARTTEEEKEADELVQFLVRFSRYYGDWRE